MAASTEKKVIIVTGPTASGKTALAIALAKHFHTEIISADSRQCYRELEIGVARPSEEELAAVQHHFIASHSIRDEINAAGFEQYALEKVSDLFRRHDTVIMVGGTGLYIKAFCEGLDEIPAIDPAIRQSITDRYKRDGLAWLQEQVRGKDPLYYEKGENQNPQRLMRALEVREATGRSILGFRKGKKAERPFRILKIGLELPKDALRHHIDARVDAMLEKGLVSEAKSLIPYRELPALQTVGYAELFDYFDGKTSLDEAISLIKTHTRQYAKRQLTWFRKDQEIKWFAPGQVSEIIQWLG